MKWWMPKPDAPCYFCAAANWCVPGCPVPYLTNGLPIPGSEQ